MRFNWFRRPKTATAKQELGARGEKAAAKFLRHHGYKVLLRGFRSRSGEIDIVCRHKDWLVFVEVKTRESEQFGAPSEAVDERKQRHITKVALDYLRLLDNPPIKFRFDIVEVLMRNNARKPDEVRLIQNAFDLSEPYIY
jgi:putative endonuclease